MADIFTFVKGNKKKVYNIAGGTEEEAIKYVRYLHRNALFGTHTGLPQKIRNSKMNESLVSNIGDYSVLDVYAYPQTKCIIGTVVNFHIINDVNPLGKTYVYPCTDKNKPMGYMISDATSEELGVCLVHGVLEVPLYYFSGSTEEKKDFVEYDIENACFKFSDSGYPVFNVYQDVDGDWIAIILFGDVSSDYEYDGPFAVSVAGVTGSTTYVNVNSGDVLFNDIRGTYDEDLTTQVALNTGESVWLKTSITGNTHAYDLIATSTPPIDGSTVFYTELAKNVDGNIVQNQYGDIRYSRTKIIAGSNKITVSPSNGLGDVTIDINESVIGGGTFYTPNYTQLAISGDTVPEGYLGQTFVLPVRAGTVGFFDDGGDARAVWTDKDGSTSIQLTSGNLYPATKDGWLRVSVIDGGTSSGACLSIQDSTGNLPIYKYGSFGEKNIEYLEGIGISITGQTDSTTGVYTGKKIINMNTAFSVLVTSPTATISLTGSTNSLTITAGSGVSISANGSNGIIISATGGTVTPYVQDLTHSFSTGTATLGLTGSAITVSFTTAGNTYIEAGSNGEIVIGSTSGNLMCASTETSGLYSLYISDTSDSKVYLKEGVGISLSMSGSTITITGTTYTGGTGIDITNGTITNLLTGDGTTIQVSNNTISYIGEMPSPQNLSVSVSGNTANVGITDGTGFSIVAEGNTYLKTSQYGVIIGSTYSLPSNVYQDLTCSVDDGVATVGITQKNSKVIFEGMGNNYITTIRSTATISEIESWGTRADGSYKNAGWRGIIPLSIFSYDVSDDYVMTEVSLISEVDGVDIEYPLIVPDTTDEELSIIASVAVGETSAQDIPAYLRDKALDWALYRISQNKSPFYNGDAIDAPLRNIPNADSVIIYGVVPVLNHSISSNTATVGIYGTTNTVTFTAGENTTITEGEDGEIVIGATFTVPPPTPPSYQGLYTENRNSEVCIRITGDTSSVPVLGGTGCYVERDSNGAIIIGSTFTEIPQDLSTSITGTTAFINLSGSTSNVKLIKGNNITLEAGEGSNEIVIGSTFSEFEYDGPFAVKVDHVDETTPTTLYIVVNTGVITYEKKRKNINAVTTSTSLSSGQSYWLKYNTVSGAVSYYKASSPQADSNNVIQVKLAENVNGVLKQVQFGEIILSKPDLTWEYDTDNHIVSLGVTGSTKSITMYGKNGIVLSNDNTSNTIAIYLSGTIGTVTGITSSVASNSATISAVGGTGSVILSGGSNTYIESGDNGEIIIGSTVSGNIGTVTGITSSISGTTAFVSTIGGTGGVVFYGVGGTTISGGTNGEIVIGSTVGGGSDFAYTGSFKVECWDTEDEGVVHNVRIYDSNNRDDMVGYAGWVHIGNQKYHVSDYTDTFSDGDVIYLVGTFNDSNALSQLTFTKIQTFFPTINDNQFCVRICYATNGKMYQTQYGDIVQPARLVGDGETVEIHSNVISAIGGGGGGTVQGLYSAIKGGTPAICITGSTTYVPIAGGTNTYTERDSSGAIIVGCTASGGGGSGYVVNHYYHTQYSYLTNSGGTGILQAIANCSYDILLKSNSDTFTVEQLKVRYSSTAPSSQVASIDDEGCLLIELPTGVTEECYIDFHFAYPVTTVFASPDGKNIVDVYGANTNMTQPYADNNTVRMIYVTTDSDYADGCWYFTII